MKNNNVVISDEASQPKEDEENKEDEEGDEEVEFADVNTSETPSLCLSPTQLNNYS